MKGTREQGTNGDRPKVLIIDDDHALRRTMEKALKREQYTLLFAENGKEGLAMMAKEPPNLVFLDLRMPVMDGFEFLEELQVKPDDPFLVVVITGHGDEQEVERCFGMGINFFLRKPLSLAEVCGLARSCLDIKRTEQALRDHRANLEAQVEKRTKNLAEQLHFQQNLIDAIPTPVFFKDTKSRFLGCNTAFEQAMGLSRGDIVGKKTDYFSSKEEAAAHDKIDREVIKKHRQRAYESSVAYADGSQREMMICKASFRRASGRVGGLIGVMFDLTERKQAEEELSHRSKELEEVNIALRVLLQRVNKAKEEIEEKIVTNIKRRVLPHLNQLEARLPPGHTRSYVDVVKKNLGKITETFPQRVSSSSLNLSPREVQVADFIKLGKTNKEMSRLMNISQNAVEFHRNNLRKKLGLKHKKLNLRTHLLSLD